MTFKINRKRAITEFINPLLAINRNGMGTLFFKNDQVYTIYSSVIDEVHFYSTFTLEEFADGLEKINLDISKLRQALECIADDLVVLRVETINNFSFLTYCGADHSFRIRLLTDASVAPPAFNPFSLLAYKKIQAEFSLDEKQYQILKKGLSFSSEHKKFGLETENSNLYLFFGDKKQNHLDGMKILISSNNSFAIKEHVYRLDFLDRILSVKEGVNIKILDIGSIIASNKTNTTIYCTSKNK